MQAGPLQTQLPARVDVDGVDVDVGVGVGSS
jgi:hypothetical protein